jgi:hypothetical protein
MEISVLVCKVKRLLDELETVRRWEPYFAADSETRRSPRPR